MYLLLSRNSFPTRVSRSFLLSLFLFIYESHYVAFRVMLRETSSGMVFFLSFFLSFLFYPLNSSFSRSLLISSFWFPRSFFIEYRNAPIGLQVGCVGVSAVATRWAARKLDADQIWWLRVHSTILLFSFPMSSAGNDE